MDSPFTFKVIFKLDPERIEVDEKQETADYLNSCASLTKSIAEKLVHFKWYETSTQQLQVIGHPCIHKGDDPRIEFEIKITKSSDTVYILTLERVMCILPELLKTEEMEYAVVVGSPLSNNFSPGDTFQLDSFVFCSIRDFSTLYQHRRVSYNREDFFRSLPAQFPSSISGKYNKKVSQNIALQNNRCLELGDYVFDSLLRIQQSEAGVDRSCIKFTPGSWMLVQFEHNRKLINVEFIYTRKGTRKIIDYIKLTVDYASILQFFANIENACKDSVSLRLLFRLRSPPVIRRCSDLMAMSEPNHHIGLKGERCTHWDDYDNRLQDDLNKASVFGLVFNNMNASVCASLIGRLQSCLKMPVELRNFVMEQVPKILNPVLSKDFTDDFDAHYALEALFSRGSYFLCYLHEEDERNEFFGRLQRVKNMYGKQTMMSALERLQSKVDELLELEHPTKLLKKIMEQILKERQEQTGTDTGVEDTERLQRSGYIKIRKVIITPTRILFFSPEWMMSNRVVRNYPPEKFLRIVFRDDDMRPIYSGNITQTLANQFILKRLKQGIRVGGRLFNFVGSSNSQLRDGGCYFMDATIEEINRLRSELGSFSATSIPKMMARLGQCFTQAKESTLNVIWINKQSISTDWGPNTFWMIKDKDFTGGKDGNGEPYIFSDGCGSMSLRAAKQIQKDLNLPDVPSCIQFRYAGFKGVLVLDPTLDMRRELLHKYQPIAHARGENWPFPDERLADFIFRESQHKFETDVNMDHTFELVKHSAPVEIFLNKPMINILDQASRMQGAECHDRICKRIYALLDQHLFGLCETLTDEHKARDKLSGFPRLIHYERMTSINMTEEPFIRSILRASAEASFYKLRQKLHIALPPSLGRMMFGVVDTTGHLKEGQVFVRYSSNLNDDERGGQNPPKLYTGKVMITKNPQIVAGDVRVFDAVDVPNLHHLVDVVVFPSVGNRPHPDEMAGSDLDGDEYAVIWDELLCLDKNEEAFDYTPPSPQGGQQEIIKDVQEEMAEFIVKAIKNEAVGMYANSHLARSDLFNIEANICVPIAHKIMRALDFIKTGVQAEKLRNAWVDDSPPESFEQAPDFMEKADKPFYLSNKMNGALFRKTSEISDFVTGTIKCEEKWLPAINEALLINGHEQELERAAADYVIYSAAIECLMAKYGIKCEGELFVGTFTTLRNTLSDRENDNMSFYNTARIIKEQLMMICERMRRRFFEGAGKSFESQTVVDNDWSNESQNEHKRFFNRYCKDPSTKLERLASAYYVYAYGSKQRKLLSFPWIASWDVMEVVAQRMTMTSVELKDKICFDPISDRLTAHIKTYVRDQNVAERFKRFIATSVKRNSEMEIVRKYCRTYKDLDKLLFFCVEWAAKHGAIKEDSPSFTAVHLCHLLLQFGLYDYKCEWLPKHGQWFERSDVAESREHKNEVLIGRLGGMGRFFISFIRFMASVDFQSPSSLEFGSLGSGSPSPIMGNKHWSLLHEEALRTYNHIAFTGRFVRLPSVTDKEEPDTNHNFEEEFIEDTPFVIEIPVNRHRTTLAPSNTERLKKHTGCAHLFFRIHPTSRILGKGARNNVNGQERPLRFIVSSAGRRSSVRRLRQLLSVHPGSMDLTPTTSRRQQVERLSRQCADQIECLSSVEDED